MIILLILGAVAAITGLVSVTAISAFPDAPADPPFERPDDGGVTVEARYTQQQIIEALDASTYDGQVNEVVFRSRLGLPLSDAEHEMYDTAANARLGGVES